MKNIILLIGILLGMGGIWLYQWMKPFSDDPYFFLNPKPNYIGDKAYSIEKDINLFKKVRLSISSFGIPLSKSQSFYIYFHYHHHRRTYY